MDILSWQESITPSEYIAPPGGLFLPFFSAGGGTHGGQKRLECPEEMNHRDTEDTEKTKTEKGRMKNDN
jgi:hypothetical protein